MLLDLLNLLRKGRTHSLAELARALSTSVEMVEVMLQDLGRMGHVQMVDEHAENGHAGNGCDCDAACPSCPRSGGCIQVHSGRIWTVNPNLPQSP
jgi:hypothetical protein